jgi:hypothetical protein
MNGDQVERDPGHQNRNEVDGVEKHSTRRYVHAVAMADLTATPTSGQEGARI